jgi:hypothetical protein
MLGPQCGNIECGRTFKRYDLIEGNLVTMAVLLCMC